MTLFIRYDIKCLLFKTTKPTPIGARPQTTPNALGARAKKRNPGRRVWGTSSGGLSQWAKKRRRGIGITHNLAGIAAGKAEEKTLPFMCSVFSFVK